MSDQETSSSQTYQEILVFSFREGDGIGYFLWGKGPAITGRYGIRHLIYEGLDIRLLP
jgi:hypothetical protein